MQTTMEPTIDARLGKCEVCGAQVAKYTCPKCEVKTCCLKCVYIHKKELECDGIRDPTKFIKLNNFTSVDVLNDYRMLEQVGRVVEGLHKNKLPREFKNGKRILPKNLNKLKSVAEQRKINIKFLPKDFERRTKNRTFYHKHKDLIHWNVEWVFPNADNMRVLDHGCPENHKVSAVFHKYLHGKADQFQIEKLSFYLAAGTSNLVFLMKAENVKGDKYYELDSDLTICENLKGKTVIEYPIIHVVLKGHDAMYELIESEQEEEEITIEQSCRKISENPGNVVLAHLLNEAAKEEVPRTKNLLFVTEYSDAELSSDDNT